MAVDTEVAEQFGFVFDLRFSNQADDDSLLVLVLGPPPDDLRWDFRPGGPEKIVEDERPLNPHTRLYQIVVQLEAVPTGRVAPIILAAKPRHRIIPT